MIDKVKLTKEYGSAIFINTNNLKNNYLSLKNLVKPVKVAPVLKSNAYGIGLKEVTNLLIKYGCDEFFVATKEEALVVRNCTPKSKIYVLHGIFYNTEDSFIKNNLIPVLNSIDQLEKWLNYAKKLQKKLDCIFHIDSGINRLGFSVSDLEFIFNKYNKDVDNYFNINYVISHLACSSIENDKFNQVQLNNFKECYNKYFKCYKASLISSYGIFFGKEYYFDLIRPGFSLYGSNPTPKKDNPLLPVIEFYTTILKVNKIKKGNSIGYNHLWKASKDSIIATVSVGYSDGILINHNIGGGFFINNQKVPIVGRVSMDCLMIDITNLKDAAKEGDVVEIIGPNQDIDAFANLNQTINCHALNILSLRYPRFYY